MADKDIGLRESARLFAETMAERYCKEDDTKNGVLILVAENESGSAGIVGNGNELVNALGTAMMKDADLDAIVSKAFIGLHGDKLYDSIKAKIKNNEV